jgi:hypothetical protein
MTPITETLLLRGFGIFGVFGGSFLSKVHEMTRLVRVHFKMVQYCTAINPRSVDHHEWCFGTNPTVPVAKRKEWREYKPGNALV